MMKICLLFSIIAILGLQSSSPFALSIPIKTLPKIGAGQTVAPNESNSALVLKKIKNLGTLFKILKILNEIPPGPQKNALRKAFRLEAPTPEPSEVITNESKKDEPLTAVLPPKAPTALQPTDPPKTVAGQGEIKAQILKIINELPPGPQKNAFQKVFGLEIIDGESIEEEPLTAIPITTTSPLEVLTTITPKTVPETEAIKSQIIKIISELLPGPQQIALQNAFGLEAIDGESVEEEPLTAIPITKTSPLEVLTTITPKTVPETEAIKSQIIKIISELLPGPQKIALQNAFGLEAIDDESIEEGPLAATPITTAASLEEPITKPPIKSQILKIISELPPGPQKIALQKAFGLAAVDGQSMEEEPLTAIPITTTTSLEEPTTKPPIKSQILKIISELLSGPQKIALQKAFGLATIDGESMEEEPLTPIPTTTTAPLEVPTTKPPIKSQILKNINELPPGPQTIALRSAFGLETIDGTATTTAPIEVLPTITPKTVPGTEAIKSQIIKIISELPPGPQKIALQNAFALEAIDGESIEEEPLTSIPITTTVPLEVLTTITPKTVPGTGAIKSQIIKIISELPPGPQKIALQNTFGLEAIDGESSEEETLPAIPVTTTSPLEVLTTITPKTVPETEAIKSQIIKIISELPPGPQKIALQNAFGLEAIDGESSEEEPLPAIPITTTSPLEVLTTITPKTVPETEAIKSQIIKIISELPPGPQKIALQNAFGLEAIDGESIEEEPLTPIPITTTAPLEVPTTKPPIKSQILKNINELPPGPQTIALRSAFGLETIVGTATTTSPIDVLPTITPKTVPGTEAIKSQIIKIISELPPGPQKIALQNTFGLEAINGESIEEEPLTSIPITTTTPLEVLTTITPKTVPGTEAIKSQIIKIISELPPGPQKIALQNAFALEAIDGESIEEEPLTSIPITTTAPLEVLTTITPKTVPGTGAIKSQIIKIISELPPGPQKIALQNAFGLEAIDGESSEEEPLPAIPITTTSPLEVLTTITPKTVPETEAIKSQIIKIISELPPGPQKIALQNAFGLEAIDGESIEEEPLPATPITTTSPLEVLTTITPKTVPGTEAIKSQIIKIISELPPGPQKIALQNAFGLEAIDGESSEEEPLPATPITTTSPLEVLTTITPKTVSGAETIKSQILKIISELPPGPQKIALQKAFGLATVDSESMEEEPLTAIPITTTASLEEPTTKPPIKSQILKIISELPSGPQKIALQKAFGLATIDGESMEEEPLTPIPITTTAPLEVPTTKPPIKSQILKNINELPPGPQTIALRSAFGLETIVGTATTTSPIDVLPTITPKIVPGTEAIKSQIIKIISELPPGPQKIALQNAFGLEAINGESIEEEPLTSIPITKTTPLEVLTTITPKTVPGTEAIKSHVLKIISELPPGPQKIALQNAFGLEAIDGETIEEEPLTATPITTAAPLEVLATITPKTVPGTEAIKSQIIKIISELPPGPQRIALQKAFGIATDDGESMEEEPLTPVSTTTNAPLELLTTNTPKTVPGTEAIKSQIIKIISELPPGPQKIALQNAFGLEAIDGESIEEEPLAAIPITTTAPLDVLTTITPKTVPGTEAIKSQIIKIIRELPPGPQKIALQKAFGVEAIDGESIEEEPLTAIPITTAAPLEVLATITPKTVPGTEAIKSQIIKIISELPPGPQKIALQKAFGLATSAGVSMEEEPLTPIPITTTAPLEMLTTKLPKITNELPPGPQIIALRSALRSALGLDTIDGESMEEDPLTAIPIATVAPLEVLTTITPKIVPGTEAIKSQIIKIISELLPGPQKIALQNAFGLEVIDGESIEEEPLTPIPILTNAPLEVFTTNTPKTVPGTGAIKSQIIKIISELPPGPQKIALQNAFGLEAIDGESSRLTKEESNENEPFPALPFTTATFDSLPKDRLITAAEADEAKTPGLVEKLLNLLRKITKFIKTSTADPPEVEPQIEVPTTTSALDVWPSPPPTTAKPLDSELVLKKLKLFGTVASILKIINELPPGAQKIALRKVFGVEIATDDSSEIMTTTSPLTASVPTPPLPQITSDSGLLLKKIKYLLTIAKILKIIKELPPGPQKVALRKAFGLETSAVDLMIYPPTTATIPERRCSHKYW